MNNTLMNRLGEIVGANGLVSEPSKVELETRTCIPFRQIPDCVVYPDSAEQVQRIVALAQELKVPKAFLTHMSHQIGKHADVNKTLPDNMQLAWDGLVIHV